MKWLSGNTTIPNWLWTIILALGLINLLAAIINHWIAPALL